MHPITKLTEALAAAHADLCYWNIGHRAAPASARDAAVTEALMAGSRICTHASSG
jgi:hypothetical protein